MESIHILSGIILVLLLMLAYIIVHIINPPKPANEVELEAHNKKIRQLEHQTQKMQHDLTVQTDKLLLALELEPEEEPKVLPNPKKIK